MMKKLFLLPALFLFFLYLVPQKVYAGPQCTSLGGSCKTSCSSNEQSQGLQDCTPNPKGPSERCCVPVPVTPAPGGTGGTGGGGANITCNGDGGINTAVGCLSFTNTTELLQDILGLGIGIGGGIAFILMLVAGFQIMTSTGNPDRLRAGQELLTSAIAGLILLVFSVFILRVIGVDILGISGLEQL